ncbi:MAG: tetratricopeptide repeat protein [Gammaproteobacteria bacterium]
MKWKITSPGLAASGLCIALVGCATAPPAPRDVPVIERSTTKQPESGQQALPQEQPPGPKPPPAPLSGGEVSRSQEPDPEAVPATPVVVALLDAADRQKQAGELPAAAASLERALRIEPRNPETWYQLAVIRFGQGHLDQAEQLARKAEALAGGDNVARARSWHLIAAAREQAGDLDGARTARQTAEALQKPF